MINLSAIPHPIPTLLVAFDILNPIENHKVISQLQQIARLHGTTVRINLKTTGGNIPSLLKPPEIHDTDISQALAIADAAISPNYLADPKGQPFQQRVSAVRPKMRDIVLKQLKGQRGKIITSRKDYMAAAQKSLRGTFRGNDIYSAWTRVVTAV
ncbi:MAG: hypothetical protein CMM54_07635 [Rhodospirillaceae bacterium]|nr:hypothetical protein [Rhodospirillaceae bacterium]|tara:strand:+ start:840 stop:1304 length:465 start_codon:yes stop_codon:yes gene_type:complete